MQKILGCDKVIEIRNEENTMTVMLCGELDHHNCAALRKSIDAAAESERPKVLKLDFSQVKFMDSSAIGLVMGRFRQMSFLGGTLQVVNIPQPLQRMFALSGLEVLGVFR